MQIEIKINGEAAELHDVLRALLNSTAPATAAEVNSIDLRKPAATKAPAKAKEPTVVPTPNPEPQQTAAPEAKPTPQPEPQPEVSNPSTDAAISFEEFRAAVGAAALLNKDAVKAVLKKYDATKTSEVIPELYAECLTDIKAIK